ncbi:hypothetical protein SDC9_147454 [bioreactor metagenome]|uniref:TfoX C-terminal domain-containing protein n=1 Tax=bioreactor metagenome TaxID=1076179 RepID=A0A645EFZ5_9ZZZZ
MKLTELPNIGPVLAENLKKVGIETPEELQKAGTYDAFMRIRTQVDSGACLHQLEAIEGAVEGMKKSALAPEKKAELRAFHKNLK